MHTRCILLLCYHDSFKCASRNSLCRQWSAGSRIRVVLDTGMLDGSKINVLRACVGFSTVLNYDGYLYSRSRARERDKNPVSC